MCYSVIYPLPFNQTPIDNYQAWSTGVKTGTPQSNATRNSTLIQAQNLKNSIKSCKMIQIHSNFQLRPQVFPKNIHPPTTSNGSVTSDRSSSSSRSSMPTVPAVAALAGALRGGSGAAEEFRGGVALQQAPEGILCGDGWPVRFPSGYLVS